MTVCKRSARSTKHFANFTTKQIISLSPDSIVVMHHVHVVFWRRKNVTFQGGVEKTFSPNYFFSPLNKFMRIFLVIILFPSQADEKKKKVISKLPFVVSSKMKSQPQTALKFFETSQILLQIKINGTMCVGGYLLNIHDPFEMSFP